MSIDFRIGFFALALSLVLAHHAHAADYPVRPVRLIVPFPPGGGTDFLARTLGQKLGERLGQQFVLDNRPGGGGVTATEITARANADGYTLLLAFNGPLAASPHLEKVSYDAARDFAAVSMLAASYHMLVAHPSVPAKNVRQLIELAQARPGLLNFASSGNTTNPHLVGELFKAVAKIDIVHVPYKGTGPAAMSVLAGESQLMFSNLTAVLQSVRSNRLTGLAVTQPKRSALAPEIPTMTESGVRGIDVESWFALVAPAATPREVIARLNNEVARIAATPDYRALLEKNAFDVLTSKPEAFPAFVRAEREKWGKVIKAASIQSN
jgi:tripartite-type tricarboxylate transporter receptor subunit TctC